MTYVLTTPDLLGVGARDLASVGSAINETTAAAAAATTQVVAPAADQISTAIAGFLSAHGRQYQELSAQLAQFHDQMVQTLRANDAPRPYVWTATAESILAKVPRGRIALEKVT